MVEASGWKIVGAWVGLGGGYCRIVSINQC